MDADAREERRSRRVVRRMDREAARFARRARRRRPGAAGALLVLGTVVGLAVVGAVVAGFSWRDWFEPRAYVEIDGRALGIPDPAPSAGRLRPAVPVTTDGAYAFLHTDELGGPVGYDPCRPVRYVVRPDGMPAGGQAVIDEAAAVVGAASGLVLEYAGTTDEEPAVERALIQPERYGDSWAPVLVAWSDEATIPELAGEVAGVGGSAAVPGADGTGQWLAAGRVVLDAADLGAMLREPGGHDRARALVVHELAHVLGLDHVDDPTELMYPVSASRTDLGPGDLAGLAQVGQVACED
ncbi:matrixin family metalloprotease [Actinotalea fermentans]|uniref:Peptidase M10 metallopeptidase domain-containing protein n=1 Tax=Actinotalea fermentans TaxID=43671 RepID=A0A511YVR7_9CELL|nr:matrixin family metalloprotease [Actinotalea fermentans]KGM17380.1 hypothetical protein N867_04405 [Actinotalea fermentans ATCC 43279 = JCM 9966 = DSM 3133]GEN79259.1 hypothetical protein AFE02nite_09930 [Actinotalea fermentans]